MRSQHVNGKTKSVAIIPVGIVYTNKSKFRSRVSLLYVWVLVLCSNYAGSSPVRGVPVIVV